MPPRIPTAATFSNVDRFVKNPMTPSPMDGAGAANSAPAAFTNVGGCAGAGPDTVVGAPSLSAAFFACGAKNVAATAIAEQVAPAPISPSFDARLTVPGPMSPSTAIFGSALDCARRFIWLCRFLNAASVATSDGLQSPGYFVLLNASGMGATVTSETSSPS